MSQHADLLTHVISKGVRRRDHANIVVNDFIELLDALDYDESFTDYKTAVRHIYGHAKWMMTQTEGLYGVTWAYLDMFVTQLWCENQWLSD